MSSDAQRAMYEYWLKVRGKGQVPPKTALDPVEFPRKALPLLTVVEPAGEDDFKIRITGTGIRAATGRDLTGLKISEIEGAGPILDRLLQCRNSAVTDYAAGSADWARKPGKYFTALVLPFGTPQSVERVMLVFSFTNRAPEG
ncbi:PAS domain-containing protein [Nisaea sediminum]|uniref:PAS domain-containing protein n=1 Tax=Nisaea sediminum TaxID=2775867 RepID=UPI001868EEF5|nr:PAS domain-containing protein [Nisaea sediminum]